MLIPNNLVCEYFANPLGLDVRQPRLSWQVKAGHRNAQQSAYQILVGHDKDPLLRRSFVTAGKPLAARIYATSLGVYELRLNGLRVGDAVLTPGWTSYSRRLQYQTYDVTGLIQEGENVIGAMLSNGWYRSYIGFTAKHKTYGDRLALLLQIHLTYADGRVQIIGSDGKWRATKSPILASDIYNGETYDARLEKPGWDRAGFDDSSWLRVRQLEHSKDIVVAQVGPYIRRHETLQPVRILHSPKGETILDSGQNMVGWVQMRARGPAGTTITLRHAEVLDQQGNLYTENLRLAAQTTRFTLKGVAGTDERFEPHFTFQGFRYVAVEGYPGEPALEHFTGIVLHSDTPPTGSFECSNPLINQLQHNIVWSQKSNFVDVPTDCPQRDERLGWTGDIQVFTRTACFNMDVAAFFTKWLRDLSADQLPNGNVPYVVPDVAIRTGTAESDQQTAAGAAAWSDAAVICPWINYQCYADSRLLDEQYESMAGWVTCMRDRAGDDWLYQVVVGIELDPEAPGYRRILIQPQPGGGLTFAGARLDAMVGRIESKWMINGDNFALDVTIPANTEGVIRLPARSIADISEQGQALDQAGGIRDIRQEDGAVIVTTGSGRYYFSTKLR